MAKLFDKTRTILLLTVLLTRKCETIVWGASFTR